MFMQVYILRELDQAVKSFVYDSQDSNFLPLSSPFRADSDGYSRPTELFGGQDPQKASFKN